MSNMSGSHLTKEFFQLVKAIGESKSKQEEDRIIALEVKTLKSRMKGGGRKTKKKMKEFLLRMIYSEMLGHDTSFGYIRAVEMTASAYSMHKRIGYLCASLCLGPEHPLRFMMVSQLQRDLQSANLLVCASALIALCKLVTKDMIPALLPLVVSLLKHKNPIIRKKAVMGVMRFWQLDSDSIASHRSVIGRQICDPDPSVMGSGICLTYEMIKEDPNWGKFLVTSIVAVQRQLIQHRLPRDYDYHRIPAPWIQIKLLKMLGVLCESDQKQSEQVYEVLDQTMKRADTGINAGYAIIYECVRTVARIYPNPKLLDNAAAAISRFIGSENQNLKYLGVTGLGEIVQDHPKYAVPHQMVVMDCLDDPDETIQRKTLDLLFRIANPQNVTFLGDRMLKFLRKTNDVFLRTELTMKITELAERFAPSPTWYITTMTEVFRVGGDLVQASVANNVRRLIAEGSGDEDEEEADEEMRRDAVKVYMNLFDEDVLPDILQQVMAWVLGEYGYTMGGDQLPGIADKLCGLAERQHSDPDTKTYIVSALIKLVAQMESCPPRAVSLIEKFSASKNTDLQQRCYEFGALLKDPALLGSVFPVDASCEDVEVDAEMSFLDAFVHSARQNGARAYIPRSERGGVDELDDLDAEDDAGWKFDQYAKPELPVQDAFADPEPAAPTSAEATGDAIDDFESAPIEEVGLQAAAGPWSASGLNEDNEPEPEPEPVAAPSAGEYDFDPAPVAAAPAAADEPEYDEVWVEEEIIEEPPELTEKEKMAAMMFGGIAPAAEKREPIRRIVRKKIRVPRNKSGAAPAPAPASGGGDFDDMLGLGAPAPPAPPAAAPAAASNDAFGLDDLLGGGGAPAPSSGGGALDIFGDSGGGGGGGAPDYQNLQVGGAIAGMLGANPRVPASGNELMGNNSSLYASGFRVKMPQQVVLVIFLSNASGSALSNVQVSFNLPANTVKAAFAGEPMPSVAGGVATFASIGAGDSVTLVAKLSLASPNGTMMSGIQAMAKYGGESLQFTVPTAVTDWIRPSKITTAQFGPAWTKKLPARKGAGGTGISAPQDFMSRIAQATGLHPVQAIARTKEGILAGVVAGTGGRMTAMAHGKVTGTGGVNLTVKSQVKPFADAIFEACIASL